MIVNNDNEEHTVNIDTVIMRKIVITTDGQVVIFVVTFLFMMLFNSFFIILAAFNVFFSKAVTEFLLPLDIDFIGSNKLETNGNHIKFDNLGPVIVNKDGTLSRIINWNEMTESERTATSKRITSRNQERKKKLADEL